MAGLPLPHKFTPTHKAVQATLSAHATGPIELFLLACNIETDISLDERLAQRGYRALIDENQKKNKTDTGAAAAASSSASETKNEEERKHPFAVPVMLPASRSQVEAMETD